MAALFPVRAVWPGAPHDLRSVALPLLTGLDEMPAIVRLVLADGEHGFATPAAAAAHLRGAARPVEAVAIELSGGFPIQSDPELIGQFGHVGIERLFHLRPADSDRLVAQVRAIGSALIERAGALAVWFGAAREDNSALAAAAEHLESALRTRHRADPLPLAGIDPAAWMLLWQASARVDLPAHQRFSEGVAGICRPELAPWAPNILG